MQIGRYECIGELASGGMGTVYLARTCGEGGFERLFALKVMHPHLEKDEQFRSMFLDEAKLAALIRHPNVVSTIDVQQTVDGLFLVMDYVEGPSLYALRKRFTQAGVPMPLDIVLRIVCDILAGLQVAHDLCDEQGEHLQIVHRDVTPHNILIGSNGVARLTDFGVARAATQSVRTETGQIKGKLAYMPPEQITGAQVDARCDVYAAGVTLWEALANERMFVADNQVALLGQVVGAKRLPPTDDTDRVPQPILDVCMRAVSIDADERPASAAEFISAITEAANRGGVELATRQQVASMLAANQEAWLSANELRKSFEKRAGQSGRAASGSSTSVALVHSAKTMAGAIPTSRWRTALIASACMVLGAGVSASVASSRPTPRLTLQPNQYAVQAAAGLEPVAKAQPPAPPTVAPIDEPKKAEEKAPEEPKKKRAKRRSMAGRHSAGREYRPQGL